VRLEVKSGQDLNDPEVKKEILAKVSPLVIPLGKDSRTISFKCSSDGADPEGEGDVRRSSTFMENPIRWECLPDEGPEEE